MTEPELDPTLIAVRSILASPSVLEEFAFQLIGPADNRTASDEDAAERFAAVAHELAANRVLRTEAPALHALAVLGLLDSVDWRDVVAQITRAVQPKHAWAMTFRRR